MADLSRRNLLAASGATLALSGLARAEAVKPRLTAISQWAAGSDGAAISALGKLFDRFFTYRPDEQRNHRHTGLGLSIVKAIVEGYGGSVRAANNPEGGAVFEVRLPAA